MLAAVASLEGIDDFGFFDIAMPLQPDNMINFPRGIFVFFFFLISLNKDIDSLRVHAIDSLVPSAKIVLLCSEIA